MMKTTYGSVINPKTWIEKDITVKTHQNSLKDILIGGCVIVAGVAYMTISAFKNGSMAYMNAEEKALDEAGLITRKSNGDPHLDLYIHTDKTKK